MSEAATDLFEYRHLGPRSADLDHMLRVVAAPSLAALIDETVPAGIRLPEPLDLPAAESEAQLLERLRAAGARNELWRSFIGQGYYDCFTPSVILRNVLENPGWYTPYTPYQAEAAQGRLEALLNFQTVVEDLTAMEVANASLLDEATAAAEAMTFAHRIRARHPGTANRFVVAANCFPHTIAVVCGRAEPLGIEVVVADPDALDAAIGASGSATFGVLVQSPDRHGTVRDVASVVDRAQAADALVIVAKGPSAQRSGGVGNYVDRVAAVAESAEHVRRQKAGPGKARLISQRAVQFGRMSAGLVYLQGDLRGVKDDRSRRCGALGGA